MDRNTQESDKSKNTKTSVSNSHVIFGLFSPRHQVACQFVQFVVFIVQSLVLKFQVLELFVLVEAVRLEKVGQVIDSFGDFLVHFVELCLGGFLKFFELELQLVLLFALGFKGFLKVVDGDLNERDGVLRFRQLVT